MWCEYMFASKHIAQSYYNRNRLFLAIDDDYFKYMIGIENGKLDNRMTWRTYNRLGKVSLGKVSLFRRLIRKLMGLFT